MDFGGHVQMGAERPLVGFALGRRVCSRSYTHRPKTDRRKGKKALIRSNMLESFAKRALAWPKAGRYTGREGDWDHRPPNLTGAPSHHRSCRSLRPESSAMIDTTNFPALPPADALTAEDFDALDDILTDLRSRSDEVPQWEFCEGFIAALICCRRLIMPSEYLPVLLPVDDEAGNDVTSLFADEAQFGRFMGIWARRWNEVAAALNAPVESLDEERAYAPELMDVRGGFATLPEAERAEFGDADLPAFGQIWALGFMYAVETWPEEWEPPRDRELAKVHDEALEAIVAMTEDDEDEPTLSALSEDGPPSVSEARLGAYGDALWAVYDLREIWSHIGERVETVRKAPAPGRNDPCPCGSGKKYKKCCGA